MSVFLHASDLVAAIDFVSWHSRTYPFPANRFSVTKLPEHTCFQGILKFIFCWLQTTWRYALMWFIKSLHEAAEDAWTTLLQTGW